jgi:hypothetical protein
LAAKARVKGFDASIQDEPRYHHEPFPLYEGENLEDFPIYLNRSFDTLQNALNKRGSRELRVIGSAAETLTADRCITALFMAKAR